jgi:hypothetical protein
LLTNNEKNRLHDGILEDGESGCHAKTILLKMMMDIQFLKKEGK